MSSALGSLLFGITTGDPVTFIEVGTLLIAVAAIAGYIPAWKASQDRSDGCIAVELTTGRLNKYVIDGMEPPSGLEPETC